MKSMRRAARNMQDGLGIDDQPVRIPGADQYRAPEKFREEILDAMKNHEVPNGYEDLVKRYYEELIR
jgi:hypothetical protein